MGIFGVLAALGRHVSRFPLVTAAVVVTVLFDTLYETAVPLLISWIIDHAVLPGRADAFLIPAALLIGGWLTSLVVQVARDFLLAYLGAEVAGGIREKLRAHLEALPFGKLRAIKAAEWQALHTADLAQVENLVLNVVPPFLFGVFYLVFGLTAMLTTNLTLGTLVLLGLPLTLVGPWLLRKKGLRDGQAVRAAETDTAAAAGELLSGQALVRTFDLGEAFARGFRQKTDGLVQRAQSFWFTANMTRRLPNLSVHLVQLALILAGTWLALHGQLKIGELVAFNLLFANVLTAVLDLASTLGPLQKAAPAFQGLQARVNSSPSGTATGTASVSKLKHGLRFDNVSFRYDPARRVLEGMSFTVPAGKRTAVVGASGSGKSTLAALTTGLYRPDLGRVLWDDLDLATADRSPFLRRVGVVFQENPVFDASLRHNVLLEDPQPGDDEKVWKALEAAGLASWVRDLPEGLDTRAGEGGGFLSGGQRQRLALARALIRNPELLVLDEATSALDPLTEGLVNDTLRSLAGTTTIVHITHRLQGITDYDQIVVLGEGRVVESGTHDELVQAGGFYAALWQRQSGLVVGDSAARITPEGLKAIPLFASSSQKTLESLTKAFVSESADPGVKLIRQGQPGTRFFVIARGRVEISINRADGEVGIATLADGDFFGEMSLLDSALTSAHVTASLPTVLLTLEKTTFLTLVAQDPELGSAVTHIARQRREENSRRSAEVPSEF